MKKLNTFQLLFSYLFPFTLQSAKAFDGTKLNLNLKNGHLSLQAPHAVYSDQANYTSFRKAFGAINVKALKPASILILGFGLGSIADMLHQLLNYSPRITGVEYDAQIIKWAKQFSKLEHIDLQQADVLEYIQQCKSHYQLVCMDIYVDQVVPEKCWTISVLKQMKKLIAPNGTLLYSTLEMRTNQALRAAFEANFKTVFTHYHVIDTVGNLVYCWKNKD